MRKLWVALAGLFAAGAVATPLALTQGNGSIDVIVGGTPTAAPAQTCDLNATTANFSTQMSAATAGETVCLASGDYGTWNGVTKTSPGVTVTPAEGASAEMTLSFTTTADPAWLILDGITIDSDALSLICAPSNNITIRNAEFRRELDIWPYTANGCGSSSESMQSANIVIEDSEFTFADDPDGSTLNKEGRLSFVDGHPTHQAGITIRNNVFDGSEGNGECGDFIQFANNAGDNSGRGVTIGPGNEFKNLSQGRCDAYYGPGLAPHSDSIQGVGMGGVTITGNYFHDNSVGIVNYDFVTDNVTISHNVLEDLGGPDICIGGSTDLLIEHNTLRDGTIRNCESHDEQTVDAIIRSNIVNGTIVNEATSTSTQSYNWCLSGTCTGTGAINGGTPTWAGGANPSTYAGFELTGGSGNNAAHDGTDIGVIP